MPKPKLPPEQRMETVSARVPQDVLQRIDGYLEEMRAHTPLLILNRADAIRQLLMIGLAEAEKPKKGRKGR